MMATTDDRLEKLIAFVNQNGPHESALLLGMYSDREIARVLQQVNPTMIQKVLDHLPEERRNAVIAAAYPDVGRQWAVNRSYPPSTVGRLMNAPLAVFPRDMRVREVIEQLRKITKRAIVTYNFVVDPRGKLIGVVVMRELLLAELDTTLEHVMLRDPFYLHPNLTVLDAIKLVMARHYPEYPVCDEHGVLLGLVRGQRLLEEQTIEISAQAGAMVGVDREERLSTPLLRSFRLRHPWLQLNLFTAFIAGAVVGFFQDTIDRVVVLAAFLPILAGQSGNTGCQTLAVTLRGMTLGELETHRPSVLIGKEALLGVLNGAAVGITAGVGMYFYATLQDHKAAMLLAGVVLLALLCSCVVSGVSGVLVPLTLKKLGADPATASSIFLTTATDVASMGFFLALATAFL